MNVIGIFQVFVFQNIFCNKIQSSVCLNLKTEEKQCTFFVLNLGFNIFDSVTRLNLLKQKTHNEFLKIM